jgi:hypothetical protein
MSEVLDEKTINLVTDLAAKAAVEAYKEEQHKKMLHDKKSLLRNTRLILVNYDIFKAHSAEMKTDIDMWLKDIFPDDELKIRSITGYKARSEKMVEYTNIKLNAYKTYIETQNLDESAHRRYFALEHRYITSKKWTSPEVADYFHVSEKTIDRDLKAAIQEFSFFLFGVVSIEDMLH